MSDINIVLENRDDIHVAVEEKDINVEVPAGKDGRSLHPQGEWSASAAYAYLDLVSYQGSSYVATKAVPAGTLPTDTSYWMLSAEKGEPGGAVWGNIAGDLSDQTDLQEALDSKAPVILSSASGSIASFTDGSASPVTALSVAIDPVQGLHGYDNPWPAGGGKNLIPYPYTSPDGVYSGVTITTQADGRIVSSGSSNNSLYFTLANAITLSAGTYTLSLIGTFQYAQIRVRANGENIITINNTAGSSSFTLENETVVSIDIVRLGTDISFNIYVQLESGSSATSYAPYSNICPISGHTSATVTRTGKNLINIADFTNGSLNPDSGAVVSSSTRNVSAYIFLKSGTYTFSRIARSQDNWSKAVLYDTAKTYVKKIYNNQSTTNTFTLDNDGYIRIGADYIADASDHFLLELGSIATTFEPYQGASVTIDLNGTRYGGVLDVLTGMLTVDRGMVVFDGANNGNRASYKYPNRYVYNLSAPSVGNTIIPTPNVNTAIGCLSDYFQNITDNQAYEGARNGFSTSTSGGFAKLSAPSIKAESREAMNAWLAEHPVTVVYPLATPFTVQLTPAQLSTLLGTNNLWADTGDVAVEYRADTKRYIDGVASATAKVTRQMIADSATADGKAPKSLATGDLIIVGDELRKATTNIGNGSAITASNSTIATLADVIKALQ